MVQISIILQSVDINLEIEKLFKAPLYSMPLLSGTNFFFPLTEICKELNFNNLTQSALEHIEAVINLPNAAWVRQVFHSQFKIYVKYPCRVNFSFSDKEKQV